MHHENHRADVSRRKVVTGMIGAAVASAAHKTFAAPATTQSQSASAGADDVAAMDRVIGRNFSESQQKQMLGILNTRRKKYADLRSIPIDPNTEPAMRFDPR